MHLIFDFDRTVTSKDTINSLASAAIAFQWTRHRHDLQATWDQVVRDYLEDYESRRAGYRPVEGERTSVVEEVAFLAAMNGVEEASLKRVEGSGVFFGLEQDDLFEMGVEAVNTGKVVVRAGFEDVLQLAERNAWQVSVISVNWSRSFIKGALSESSTPISIPITITANEISPSGKIHGPPCLDTQLISSSQKKQVLSHLTATQSHKTLYFGDSTTDMECLLQGGVVISADETSSLLLQTLPRVGVPVPHVGSRGGDANIFWARDFNEVIRSGLLEE